MPEWILARGGPWFFAMHVEDGVPSGRFYDPKDVSDRKGLHVYPLMRFCRCMARKIVDEANVAVVREAKKAGLN